MTGEHVGRTALVTGAGGGIGRAVALRLAAEGAAVAIVDVDGAAAEKTRAEVAEAGGTAAAYTADVSVDADCARGVAAAADRFGGIDVLVNNAAILTPGGSVADLPEEDWDRVLAVSLKSVYLMSRHTIPHLRRRGGGAIVNLASVHAFATVPGAAAYAAAKGGVVALTRQMALDLAADGVRVVAVAPGAVDTAMLREGGTVTDADLERAGFPLDRRRAGRVGGPEEIAAVVAFAASERASFVTGTTITADGGLLANLVQR
ncbi:SDR family NAD(P)-dependent oxidoreductase [Actinomadura rugatobispora]|uniref:SDR family NAD(P)-dependent oxidoreductase n=1 Tax=Actinomadura rugatobispora TaxID=1994 RepID=A0ABW0ZZ89_9ACTN|nr:SDR family NAD(P)-dependent oxidoreductase [Actinomadura rugatobispora]